MVSASELSELIVKVDSVHKYGYGDRLFELIVLLNGEMGYSVPEIDNGEEDKDYYVLSRLEDIAEDMEEDVPIIAKEIKEILGGIMRVYLKKGYVQMDLVKIVKYRDAVFVDGFRVDRGLIQVVRDYLGKGYEIVEKVRER